MHRRSTNLTFRVTDDLKRKGKKAARLSGRSMSEEAVYRLTEYPLRQSRDALCLAVCMAIERIECGEIEGALMLLKTAQSLNRREI
jgi:hypothetical protein